MVHQRRFWGNTRGWSVDLGRGPKQVEKTDPFRVPVLRFSTLGPACHPGAFPVQAPDFSSLGVGCGFAIWGPFGVRASDACSRSTRCEDGSQLARRRTIRSVTEEKSIESLLIVYDKTRNVVPNCQKKCHESMCRNGQDELPRAVGSTRVRARTEFSGRRGSSPAGSRPGSAESCARSRSSIRIRRVLSLVHLRVTHWGGRGRKPRGRRLDCRGLRVDGSLALASGN